MARVSQNLPDILGGISTQPAELREDRHCEALSNVLITEGRGIERRPAVRHSAQLIAGAVSENVFVHVINDEYIMVITNGDLKVFNLAGTSQTVLFATYPGDATGKDYLVQSNPREGFRAITIENDTYILNKSFVTAMAADTAGGTYKGTKQNFGALPTSPTTNDVWRIRGEPDTNWDDYYVIWDGSVWSECARPGTITTLDDYYMPRVLTQSGSTFTFERPSWGIREAGWNTTHGRPPFVGYVLQDLFFLRGRLGFLHERGVTLSRSITAPGGITQFWPRTVQAVIESDPIWYPMPPESSAGDDLTDAIVVGTQAYLMTPKGQYVLSSAEGVLGPATATVNRAFNTSGIYNCPPAVLDNDVLVPFRRGFYDGVNALRESKYSGNRKVVNLTAHVPTLIPSTVVRMNVLNDQGLLVLTRNAIGQTLYVYSKRSDVQADADDEDPKMGAWYTWDFDSEFQVQGVFSTPGAIYIVHKGSDGVYLGVMVDHETDEASTLLDFPVFLDRRVKLTGVHSGGTTTWTLPYATSTLPKVVKGDLWGTTKGQEITGTTLATSTTVTVSGDYSAYPCFLGHSYETKYRFSQLFYRGEDTDRRKYARLDGRLQVLQLTVGHTSVGYLRAEVSAPEHSGQATGKYKLPVTISNNLVLIRGNGAFTFMVGTEADKAVVDLINDSYLPSTLTSAKWKGLYTPQQVI